MTAQCQACTAPAELLLCAPCIAELRANLTALAQGPYVRTVGGRTKSGRKWHIERHTAGLLAALADVIEGRARIGSGGGHRKRGDEIRAPFEPDTENGKRTRQGEAAALLDAVKAGLSSTLRDQCESRGVELPPCDSAASAALWLASHAHAIACGEGAGLTHREAQTWVRRIERVVDRPIGRKWLGPCPSWLETERRACGVELFAAEDAIEVFCRGCRVTHNCNRLRLLQFNDLEREKITWDRLLKANKVQPEGFDVPERTLRHWRATGRLKARGYRRPDGREVITRHSDDDVPLYWWSDVRRLRSERFSPRRAV